jgi:hypothetical protein
MMMRNDVHLLNFLLVLKKNKGKIIKLIFNE